MNLSARQGLGVFKDWTDGPWRSKTVLAAILVVAVGLGFWFSGLKGNTAQNVPGIVTTSTTVATTSDAVAKTAHVHPTRVIGAVSMRLLHRSPQGAKQKGEVVADIVAAIKERRS